MDVSCKGRRHALQINSLTTEAITTNPMCPVVLVPNIQLWLPKFIVTATLPGMWRENTIMWFYFKCPPYGFVWHKFRGVSVVQSATKGKYCVDLNHHSGENRNPEQFSCLVINHHMPKQKIKIKNADFSINIASVSGLCVVALVSHIKKKTLLSLSPLYGVGIAQWKMKKQPETILLLLQQLPSSLSTHYTQWFKYFIFYSVAMHSSFKKKDPG